YLLDTNVLLRLANSSDVLHATALGAVGELDRRGESLHVTSQKLIAFPSGATRRPAPKGVWVGSVDVEVETAAYESLFPLLGETRDIYPTWKALVIALGVIGKQVFDARLVAVCHVHSITHLLTFNTAHFTRFSTFGPGLIVVDPATV